MKKYVLYCLSGDLITLDNGPVLVAEEIGASIDHVAEDLISDVKVDLSGYEELRPYPIFAYMPRVMDDPKYKDTYSHAMTGIVSPPSLPTVIHVEYGIIETDVQE